MARTSWRSCTPFRWAARSKALPWCVMGLLATASALTPCQAEESAKNTQTESSAASPKFLGYDGPDAFSTPPDLPLFSKVVAPLCGVICLILIVGAAARKRFGIGRGGVGGSKLTEVLEVTPLGNKRYVFLVRIPGRVLALGATNDRLTTLAEIKGAEAEEVVATAAQTGAFSKMLGAKLPQARESETDATASEPPMKPLKPAQSFEL